MRYIRRGSTSSSRRTDTRSASGSNCTGVVVGSSQAPRSVSNSRYDSPNVSPTSSARHLDRVERGRGTFHRPACLLSLLGSEVVTSLDPSQLAVKALDGAT